MITVSIHLNGKDMKGHKPITNILLVRKSEEYAHSDLEYIIGLGNVIAWQMFDERGRELSGSVNKRECLNWANNNFDDIDVYYHSRY